MRRYVLMSIFFLAFVGCNENTDKKEDNQKEITPEEIVRLWNDAHNAKSEAAFDSLFTDVVDYYHEVLPKDKVISMKMSYFTENSEFTQHIVSPIRTIEIGTDEVKCSFTKRVTLNNRSIDYPSYLLLRLANKKWLIFSESDDLTDKNIAAADRKDNNYPKDAIRGDYDGDGTFEFMWLEAPELGEMHGECLDGECTAYIRFNDKHIPSIPIHSAIGGELFNHGDLNGDGGDEIGVLRDWWQSVWRDYPVYGLRNFKWKSLIDITVNLNDWEDEKYTPIKKHPTKKGVE